MAVLTDKGGAEMGIFAKGLRVVAAFLALGAIVFTVAHDVSAQQKYPSRPIQLIIPYPPGGSDALSRKVYATMSKNIGQEMVVMNVPGASTQVASRKVAESAPDG
jgi:tripartite-type tricarboxylate transporter receptor subunit TctC